MSALEIQALYESDELPAIGLADDAPPAVDLAAISLAMECGRWEEALALLRPAVASPHTHSELRRDYARCLLETGRIRKAVRVLAISGERSYEHFLLVARAAALQGDKETAIRSIQDAFVLDSHATLGAAKRHEELAEFFERIVIAS